MGYTLTILGCGVMGQAVLSAIYNAPKADDESREMYPSRIITCNHSAQAAKQVTELVRGFGASPNGIEVQSTSGDNAKAVAEARVVVLGTKPYLVEEVLQGVRAEVADKLLISLAAGWTLGQLVDYTARVARVMTNTPAKYGYGAAAVSHSADVTADERALVSRLVGHLGLCVELPEKNMDAATALIGSGPAFALLMLESMMEAGVKLGIPLDVSRRCAAKVLEGTARMAEETGSHPAALKHQVCTPGGTTIAGLCVMEDSGVRSGIVKGIEEAANVAARLGRK
ncbi:AaceriABR168Wp [[Ashbya] aceris (nom. inval.)]|nr:AaceriABR168Wp [[Ashbya] aceris (nom. inval.)]